MAQLKGSLVHISTGLSSEQDGFGEKLDPLRSIVPGHLSFVTITYDGMSMMTIRCVDTVSTDAVVTSRFLAIVLLGLDKSRRAGAPHRSRPSI